MEQVYRLIDQIKQLNYSGLFQKDFLLTWEKNLDQIKAIVTTAKAAKLLRDAGYSLRVFDSGLAISHFRDKSTRTRFSYASAANLLGLDVQEIDEAKVQIAHGETVRETANMISFMAEVIGIRDDMYLGEGNKYMREVSAALDDGFSNGVLPRRPTVINLQCDIDHPTQTLADLSHLIEYFGGLENLRGKKIAMTWAYSPSYGKPLSVPQGIIGLMTRLGMQVDLAYPEGYDLIPDVVQLAQKQASESGGSFRITHSMEEAFKDADIIYPKSWAPYWVMEKRTELLKNKDYNALDDLEKQALAENARHKHWTVDEKMLSLTKDGTALYMHPLPADISGLNCQHGEVENQIFERYRILTYKQAGWKPYVITAMILASKYENIAQVLERIIERGNKRVF